MAVLKIGTIAVSPPVVLAPMAGITNGAFRTVCRWFGGGLYISEMITSRALVERSPRTLRMIRFGPDERPRSLQLYGV
ncbi:MAG TPA: tRNA-dihydrouridine synthase, partial [Actinomycetes bacterium]|nr:tRNA-dihydrouridine synthase [Actinomycetes bacterium]